MGTTGELLRNEIKTKKRKDHGNRKYNEITNEHRKKNEKENRIENADSKKEENANRKHNKTNENPKSENTIFKKLMTTEFHQPLVRQTHSKS
jgi:hypothetical protein